MMLIGYARVSTQDQTLRLQHDALTDGGCEKLFREKLSGTRTTLPAREKLLSFRGGPHQFFDNSSFSAALSRCASPSNCFSFRFSASSSLSRLASDTVIPPYLDFYR